MSRAQEEGPYDEYQYQDEQSQLTPTDGRNASRSYRELDSDLSVGLDPSSSRDPFSLDPSQTFYQSSDAQVSPFGGETFPGAGSSQWQYSTGSGTSDFGMSPSGVASSSQVPPITSPMKYVSDDFGPPTADPSWSIPNTPNQNWDSFSQLQLENQEDGAFTGYSHQQGVAPSSMVDQQSDPFSMTVASTAVSTGVASPPSSLGATGSIDASRTRKSKRLNHRSSTGGDTSSSHSSSQQGTRLRSAAQSSRAPMQRPGETDQDRAARASHNMVERNYRTRLNTEYEKLLLAVPVPSDGKKLSKHEVLELAREHIQSLEAECAVMRDENTELKKRIEELTALYQGASQG
ncbi:hypothetical protein MKZ38_006810 [Zalerion maritima]|uniref:BHLH domain-containing protein n=1 Tax=Zalerion maritima TaxID=339359 RepID=A0AAD5WVQ8_9PEZI|nr:hypothetical protein MKZ38_006810 [Zalerion maritima]